MNKNAFEGKRIVESVLSFKIMMNLATLAVASILVLGCTHHGKSMEARHTEAVIADRHKVSLPIEYGIFRHERELYDWHPDFMLNVPNFDLENNVYIRSRNGDRDSTGFVESFREGRWHHDDFVEVIRRKYPNFRGFNRASGWWPARIVFDLDNDAYTLMSIFLGNNDPKSFIMNKGVGNPIDPQNRVNLLLYSRDQCRTWSVHEIPIVEVSATPLIEYQTGPHLLDGPPLIGLAEKLEKHPSRWADVNHFYVYAPVKTAKGLEFGEPISISRRSFGLGGHSGGGSFATRVEGQAHIVWGDVVDNEREAEGSPIMGISLDLATRELSKPLELSRTFPANDIHNSPAICADNKGFLHVMTGSHQYLFDYMQSSVPNSLIAGVSKIENTVSKEYLQKKRYTQGGQTYVSMVCDDENTLHIAYRDLSKTLDHLGGEYHLNMVYQRKRQGMAWEAPRMVVRTPSPGYSCYYQKMARDQWGRVFLSYSYTNRTPPYNDIPMHHFRSMLMTDDGGDSWRLVDRSVFE